MEKIKLPWFTNDKLRKFRLKGSICANHDIASLRGMNAYKRFRVKFVGEHEAKIKYMFEVILNYCALINRLLIPVECKRPDVCQAEITNMNVRGGRMKRKMQSFTQQTSLDGQFILYVSLQDIRLSYLVCLLSAHFTCTLCGS